MSAWRDGAQARRERRQLARALATATELFIDADGIVSVGVGRSEDGGVRIVVGVRSYVAIRRASLPDDVEGIPVVFQEVGEVSADPDGRSTGSAEGNAGIF